MQAFNEVKSTLRDWSPRPNCISYFVTSIDSLVPPRDDRIASVSCGSDAVSAV